MFTTTLWMFFFVYAYATYVHYEIALLLRRHLTDTEVTEHA